MKNEQGYKVEAACFFDPKNAPLAEAVKQAEAAAFSRSADAVRTADGLAAPHPIWLVLKLKV